MGHVIGSVLVILLWIFLIILIVRLVAELIMAFSRTYRPAGAVASVFEVAFTATDPALKSVRRLIPPLRVGRRGFGVDIAFIALFLAVGMLIAVAASL